MSWVLVSALPKSKQQPELTLVPLATMYMPSGWPLTAIPCVVLSRYPMPPVKSTPYALWPLTVIGSAVALAGPSAPAAPPAPSTVRSFQAGDWS